MQKIHDSNKYPIEVQSGYLSKYVNCVLPCIVFFEAENDKLSENIVKNVTSISLKYPNVFCYKVHWRSNKKFYPFINPDDIHRVTVWKSRARIMSYMFPSYQQIYEIFSYVEKSLIGVNQTLYQQIIKKDSKRLIVNKRNQIERFNLKIKGISNIKYHVSNDVFEKVSNVYPNQKLISKYKTRKTNGNIKQKMTDRKQSNKMISTYTQSIEKQNQILNSFSSDIVENNHVEYKHQDDYISTYNKYCSKQNPTDSVSYAHMPEYVSNSDCMFSSQNQIHNIQNPNFFENNYNFSSNIYHQNEISSQKTELYSLFNYTSMNNFTNFDDNTHK